MRYFLKSITSVRDQTIKHVSLDVSCIPFSLLSIYGMSVPLRGAEAEFMVGVLRAAMPEGAALAVSRIAFRRTSDYRLDAGRHLSEVTGGGEGVWITHVCEPKESLALVELLARHWETFGGGHWLLCDCPTEPVQRASLFAAMPRNREDPARAHGQLLQWATFVAVSFDDNLFDVFIRHEESQIQKLVEGTASRAGIAVSRSRTG